MFPLRSTLPWGKRGLDRANLPVPKGGAALGKSGGETLCVLPQAAGSSGLCVILAGGLLGCARPGSMREPFLNKQGRTEHRARGVGLLLISSVNFTLLSLKEVYFCQSLDPVTPKLSSRALASQKVMLKEGEF